MYIRELLSQPRVLLDLQATDKKQLFELLGQILCAGAALPTAQQAAQALLARERLGSTGVGAGVALPHGRVKGLERPVGAFCTLRSALDYDAIDRKPVNMVFALLVPEHATDEHLKILAELAGLFNNKAWRGQLAEAKTPEELYTRLIRPLPAADPHDTEANHARSV